MMTDKPAPTPPTEDHPDLVAAALHSPERARIEEWELIADDAPSVDDLNDLQNVLGKAKAAAEAAFEAYARAVAVRACAFGFESTAFDVSETTKQLHVWHRKYASDVPDMSKVVDRERAKLGKKIAAIEVRLEREAASRAALAKLAERRNRIDALRNKGASK